MSNASRPCAIPRFSLAALACAATLMMASCDRRDAPAVPAATVGQSAAETFVAPKDVFERDTRAIVGISYPPGLERYPALAQRLIAHAKARRAALEAALVQTPHPTSPFELTLRFTTVADSPRMFAVTADEELYTGGAGSRPGRAVFLWLPAENRLLDPDEMIPNPVAWSRLHEEVEHLQRDESASRAAPATQRAMEHVFVPRLNSAGRIAGVRFRTDGGDEVEVPGDVLKPLVAPAYSAWFEDAPAAPAPTGAQMATAQR